MKYVDEISPADENFYRAMEKIKAQFPDLGKRVLSLNEHMRMFGMFTAAGMTRAGLQLIFGTQEGREKMRHDLFLETGSTDYADVIIWHSQEYMREHPCTLEQARDIIKHQRNWFDMESTRQKALQEQDSAREAFGAVMNKKGQLITFENGGVSNVHDDASDPKFTKDHRDWFKSEKQQRARAAEIEKGRHNKSERRKKRERMAKESRKRNRGK